MIQIEQLEGENFMCFEQVSVSLANRGVVGLCGINNDVDSADSNGSGKSSVLEMLYFAFFGETLRKIRVGQVVRKHTNGQCFVKLLFRDAKGTQFRVERYRDHKKFHNDLFLYNITDGQDLRGEDKAETQKRLNELLGMSPDLFRQVVLFGQEGMSRFSELSDSKKKELVEEIMGLHLYDIATRLARQESSTFGQKERETLQKASEFERLRISSEERVRDLLRVQKEWYAEKQQSIATLQGRIAKIELKLGEMDDTPRTVLEGSLDEIGRSLEELREKVREADRRRDKAFQAYQQSRGTLWEDQVSKQVQVAFLTQEQERMGRLRFDGICPICKQSTQGLVIEGEEEIAGKLLRATILFQKAEGKVCELDKAWKILETRIKDERRGFTEKTSQHESDIRNLQRKLSDAIPRAQLERQSEDLRNELEKREKETFPHEYMIVNSQKIAAQWEEKRIAAVAEADEAKKTSQQYAVLIEVFKTIRSLLFENLLGELNKKLAEYCQTLTQGDLSATISATSETMKGEVREKISIKVDNPQGGEDYQSCSSGERKRLDLPIAFALQDLAAKRSAGVGLALLDEVFENVDATGAEGVRELVMTLASRPHTPTVLVITHNEGLLTGFPTCWHVIKEGGVSRLEER